MRRVPRWLVAATCAGLALAAAGCSGSAASTTGSGGSTTPAAGVSLPASDLALLHSVGGLEHLTSSDLTVTKQVAIISNSGVSWTKVISVDGANSPVLGTAQFVSYLTVDQTIGDTGATYPMTLTAKGMGSTQLGFTVGHQPGEHFILLVNSAKLFAPVAVGGLKLGHSDYGETVQPYSGKLTVSLIRVVPDASSSNRELQVDAAATETCNAVLRASVAPETAALFSPKDVPVIRVEEQEDLCNSIGLAARYATVDHLTYAAYKATLQRGLEFPWLVGQPAAIGIDQAGYTYFR